MSQFYDLNTAYLKHINMIDDCTLNKIKYIYTCTDAQEPEHTGGENTVTYTSIL